MKKIVAILICISVILFSSFSTAYAMTYRTNTVEFSSSSGISITSGSFIIHALSITSGQDPQGRNYVGQTVYLSNGEFSFSVGRSGSSSVANWFNSRLSGYNDPSTNGDRTTFDHTAEELNFAFIGDLTLSVTTSNYPHGMTVTFPNVAIAQGSTMFSNNWWFGQTTGQHTLDSDGANTVLTIGSDTNGNTVYASFLRGGNDTNEITLKSICVSAAAREKSTPVSDVETAFGLLPIAGTQVNLYGFPGSYDPTTNHIQGYAQYDDIAGARYSILTHSVSTASYAHIVAGLKNGSEKLGYKTYLEGWKHPGGIQTIGDYLLVPSENDTSAHIALYDLRSLAVNELRRVESFDLSVNHKAGAVGITSYVDSNTVEYYVLIVAHLDGTNSVYHVYRAPAINGIESAAFSEVGSFSFEKDFQGFGLITEADTNNIYFVGLWSPSEGATFADYAYLYQLNTQNWSLSSEIDQIHMVSSGGAAGMLGVHFRYGANVFADSNGTLTVSATERNSVLGSALATNDWF